MTRPIAAAAVALVIALVAAESAQACSCVPPRPRQQLKQADGAFVGRLLAVRPVDPPAEGEPISSGDPVDYVYRVGRVAKGGPGLRRGRKVRVRSVRVLRDVRPAARARTALRPLPDTPSGPLALQPLQRCLSGRHARRWG